MGNPAVRLANEAYGAHERQRYDLSIPENYGGRHGLILFIHGGAWIAGDKEGYRDDLEKWLRRGYAAAAVNYHYLAPGVRMDTLIDDIALALGAIKEKAAEYGVSLERVLLTGGSAGGHLSLLYAYSRAETSPIRPACVVDYCGPTLLSDDFFLFETPKYNPPEERWIELYTCLTGIPFNGDNLCEIKKVLDEFSPVTYVSEKTVPTIICHGKKDVVVPYANALALRDKLDACGVEYVFVPMPEAGHGLETAPIFEEAEALFALYAKRFL